jgi:phospholipid/cholesterol/gamma-HCH transport system substrate-binding protein
MKISNETKVGALTAVAITVLILGFNFLKGKNIATTSTKVYAIFPNVEGLVPSNAIFINGLQVGKVTELVETDKNLTGILVTLNLTKDINIPKNSVATLSSELLGSTSIKITLGNGTKYVDDGDTIQTSRSLSLGDKVQKSIEPAIDNVNKTLNSLDDILQKLNTVLDPNARNNLQSIIANLAASTKSLEQLLNTQTGALAHSMKNLETITGSFSKNSGKIDSTFTNLNKATAKLANAKIEEAIDNLQGALQHLDKAIGKIDSKEGTLGLLLNDRQLYDDLRKTNRSLNTLLDDFRVNPKRYVNISVFGRKDKNGPLMQPLPDSAKGSKP